MVPLMQNVRNRQIEGGGKERSVLGRGDGVMGRRLLMGTEFLWGVVQMFSV